MSLTYKGVIGLLMAALRKSADIPVVEAANRNFHGRCIPHHHGLSRSVRSLEEGRPLSARNESLRCAGRASVRLSADVLLRPAVEYLGREFLAV